LGEAIPRLHQFAEAAGRDPAEFSIIPFGTIANEAKLEHYATLGIDEVVLRVRSGSPDEMCAELNTLAPLVGVAAKL
jgi:alkanesulfonate monooxygenase SsuD/methylene tetrahydromethanopterin reductase-like flavin-dependent oxidoreductase (luciferase family)